AARSCLPRPPRAWRTSSTCAGRPCEAWHAIGSSVLAPGSTAGPLPAIVCAHARGGCALPGRPGTRGLERLEQGTVPVADAVAFKAHPRRSIQPMGVAQLERDRFAQQRDHLLPAHPQPQGDVRMVCHLTFICGNTRNVETERAGVCTRKP